jgi:hypothetical protein
MRLNYLPLLLLASLAAACGGPAAVKSVEMLDEKTAITVGALEQPLPFVETGIYDLLVPDKQPSIIYMGPVEWDRSGAYSYLLWMQVAPGVGGHRLDDIRAHGAVNVTLDDGPVALSVLESAPGASSPPYQPVPPVGQTAYFSIDVPLLKRMAASQRLVLNLRAADLTRIDFTPTQATSAALKQFVIDRGIGD